MALPVLYRVCRNNASPPAQVTDPIYARPAILKDHRRLAVRWATYPGMIPFKGDSVPGTYITGLTKGDMKKLERFEGSQYKLVPITALVLLSRKHCGFGKHGEAIYSENVWEEKAAMTYMFVGGDDQLTSERWIFGEFMKSHAADWAETNDLNGTRDECKYPFETLVLIFTLGSLCALGTYAYLNVDDDLGYWKDPAPKMTNWE